MTNFSSTSQPYDWTFKRVVSATLIFVSVLFGFWLLYRFYQVVFTLFIAIVIGTVIRPAVGWLHQRGLPRGAGIILVYLLLFTLLIVFLVLLFPMIFEQGTTIAATIPGYYQDLRAWVVHYPNPLIARLSGLIPAALPGITPVKQTGLEVMASAEQALGYVTSAFHFIFTAIVIMMLAFYWTLDGPRVIQSLLMLAPQDRREGLREMIAAMEAKVGYFIAGQGVLCVIIGVMAYIAYSLIGLPNALALALIAGVLEAVPMLGPLLGAVPAALVALSIAPDKLVWVVVSTLVIQQVENSFLVPRVMSKAVGVNPFVTLLAFFAFTSLFGIAGSLMAIPIAAIIQLLLNYFVFYPTTTEPEVSSGRDFASRLRYEAQDFVLDLRKQARVKKSGSDLRVKQIDQVMDEIETIAADLDTLLAKSSTSETQ
jgi:predicted PurR-regulated permease PerM